MATAYMVKKKPSPMLTIALLLCLFVVPYCIAVYFFKHPHALPEKTTNYGHLLTPPTSIKSWQLEQANGTALNLQQYAGKWIMLFITPDVCDAACQTNLYKIRQVHTSLGKNQDRVERMLVITSAADNQALRALINKTYRGTQLAFTNQQLLKQYLPAKEKTAPGILYLVDPMGNIMMYYSEDATPKGIQTDLKHLLTASQIG